MDKHELLSSLVFCSVDGYDVEIIDNQQDVWVFRSTRTLRFKKVILFLWNTARYELDEYTCKEYALLGHHEDTFAHIYTVAICNEALISALSVLEHTDNCFDCSIGDGRMPAYVSEQIKDWLGKVVICPNIPNSNKFEMAYSANVSVDYIDILQIGVQQMISKRLIGYGLSEHPLFQNGFSRLYLGNEFCPHLLPPEKQLPSLLKAVAESKLKLTFSMPYILPTDDKSAGLYVNQVITLSRTYGIDLELVVNDFGLLFRLGQNADIPVSMGRLLNRIKKDPRFSQKKGIHGRPDWFQYNNLEGMEYEKMLRAMQVERVEGEDCAHFQYGGTLKKSFHFPFYQISTSSTCPLHAEMRHGSRKRTGRVVSCDHYCSYFGMVYNAAYHMLGYGNSIFGFCDNILSLDLPTYNDSVDRLVFDMLK